MSEPAPIPSNINKSLIKEESSDEHIELLGLLRRLVDGRRIMKCERNQLVRLTQQVTVANARAHLQAHLIVLGHGYQIGHVLEQILNLRWLLVHALREDDREQIRTFGTEGTLDRCRVPTRGVYVITRQDQGIREQFSIIVWWRKEQCRVPRRWWCHSQDLG